MKRIENKQMKEDFTLTMPEAHLFLCDGADVVEFNCLPFLQHDIFITTSSCTFISTSLLRELPKLWVDIDIISAEGQRSSV